MKKYRASILLLMVAVVSSSIHFYFGWQDAILDAETHGEIATLSDYTKLWLKETFEGFPSEFVALATELALFAGIFTLFKPYDEDTERIKELEEAIMERFDELDKNRDSV